MDNIQPFWGVDLFFFVFTSYAFDQKPFIKNPGAAYEWSDLIGATNIPAVPNFCTRFHQSLGLGMVRLGLKLHGLDISVKTLLPELYEKIRVGKRQI